MKAKLILPIALLALGAPNAGGTVHRVGAESEPISTEEESTESSEVLSYGESSPLQADTEVTIDGKTVEEWAESIMNKTILGVSIGTIVSVLVGLLTSLIRAASDRKTIAKTKEDIEGAIKLADVLTEYIKVVKEKEGVADENYLNAVSLLSETTAKIAEANRSVEALKGAQDDICKQVAQLKAMLLTMAKSDDALYGKLMKVFGGESDV